ncbi:acylphosphatase-2 isoform X1 [Bos taurus]|uniref:acylphosphatase-2 isoform X1 n=1 Tax=Bos taurus TaxID=9913 RepID=UPI0028CB9A0D|nr:acylphosphatase-2 isoform X1 [Bos taurus]
MCPLPLAAAAVTAPRSPLRLLGRGLAAAMSTGRPLKSVDYEVFGRVQGVCFRMYTEDEARKIGVVGWVKNTSKGTVTGQVQGPEEKVNSITVAEGWREGMALGQFPFIWEANFTPPCHLCLPPPACSAFPCVQHGPSLAETSFPAMVTKVSVLL